MTRIISAPPWIPITLGPCRPPTLTVVLFVKVCCLTFEATLGLRFVVFRLEPDISCQVVLFRVRLVWSIVIDGC